MPVGEMLMAESRRGSAKFLLHIKAASLAYTGWRLKAHRIKLNSLSSWHLYMLKS